MKISIVTPSYNQALYLESCIESVINQKCQDLEYIIVDGGSNDGSRKILQKYRSAFKHLLIEDDDGHADALNKGFNLATGEIMAWLNSDDMYTPWALTCVSEIFKKYPHIHWIQGLHGFWNKKGHLTGVNRRYINKYDYLLGDYMWIQQESTFWRRSLWEKAGSFINTDYRYMVDGELWTRFFEHAELYNVESLLSGYRIHDSNRASAHRLAVEQEMQMAISSMSERATSATLDILYRISLVRKVQKLPVIGKYARRGLIGKALQKAIMGPELHALDHQRVYWSYTKDDWVISASV